MKRFYLAVISLLLAVCLAAPAWAVSLKDATGAVFARSDGKGNISLLWFPPAGRWPSGGWRVTDERGRVVAERVSALDGEALSKLATEDAAKLREFIEMLKAAKTPEELKKGYSVLGFLAFSDVDNARSLGLYTELRGVPEGKRSYRVSGLDENGKGTGIALSSQAVDSSHATPAPCPPTNLRAVPGDEGAMLYWGPAEAGKYMPVVSYFAERAEAGGSPVPLTDGPLVLGARWDAKRSQLTDRDAPVEKELIYSVYSVDIFGVRSVPAGVKIYMPDPRALLPPGGLTAEAGEGSVELKWTPNPSGNTAAYVVERSFGMDGVFAALTPAGLKQGTKSFEDRDVGGGTTYFYRLRSVGPKGDVGKPSQTVSAKPKGASKPKAPSGLKADATPAMVVLTWERPESPVAGYIVERYSDGAPRWARMNQTVAREPRYDDHFNLGDYGKFKYRVKAVGFDNQESNYSKEAEAELEDTSLPPAPHITGINGNGGKVSLSFVPAPPEDRSVKFLIVRGVSPTDTGLVVGDPLPAKARSFTDEFVAAGGSYWYGVVALDRKGNRSQMEAPALVVVESPEIPAPDRPEVKFLKEPMRRAELSFKTPPAGLSVIVQRRVGESSPWVNIARDVRDGRATDPNPAEDAVYRIIYKAENGVEGAPSPEARVEGRQ